MLVDNYSKAKKATRTVGKLLPFVKRLRIVRRLKKSDSALEKNKVVIDRIARLYQEGNPPLFAHVGIETINRCNGTCGFCPVNAKLDPRPSLRMSEELLKKIIDDLVELEYKGEFALYSNNEPYLDKRIEEFIAYARTKLPECRHVLSTNGTLLTPERYKASIDNLDELIVNNYCDDFKFSERSLEIEALAKSNPEWWKKTLIKMRFNDDLLNNRAGESPNYAHRKPPEQHYGCYLQCTQLTVRPDGKLSICCNDALGKTQFGDLSSESVKTAWFDPARVELRRKILQDRTVVPICTYCNNA